MVNLLSDAWKNFDSYELRLLLDKHIGGPGQYDKSAGSPNKLYLPLARQSCRIALTFRDKKIVAIEPGPAFDSAEWNRMSKEITESLVGPVKIGRDFSFSGFRVQGSWRGLHSGVQILPPPNTAPRAPVELAEHPFILEFPIVVSDSWPLTNHRRMRQHRKLTLLLNVLLRGGTSLQPRQPRHFWANIAWEQKGPQIGWVQEFFFAELGDPVIDVASVLAGEQLEEIAPEEYYAQAGHDGQGLRVPADLDESINRYLQLDEANRLKFDRAAFWMDMADRQWTVSVSSSFASLVSAVEALTDRGTTHRVYCKLCKSECQHEMPGATERFRAFFEEFASGASLRNRRNQMYSLRSGILHGSDLMQIDQDISFGWDPPEWNERELHQELWGLTRVALRNWLKAPSKSSAAGPQQWWGRRWSSNCLNWLRGVIRFN